MGARGEWSALREVLEEGGYEIYQLKSGHYGVYRPDGTRVYILSYSPSDRRSYLNTVTWIRRNLGLAVGRRKGGKAGGDIPSQRSAATDQRS